MAGLVAVYLGIYTALVTPGRFAQCLDAPVRTYRPDPDDGLGAELPPQIDGNDLQLLVNGDEILPAMLRLIDGAEQSIRWHVMLFKPDEAGLRLADALVRAAERGVEVQLAFDGRQSANATFFAPYPPDVKEQFNAAMPVMLGDMRAAGIAVLDSGRFLNDSPQASWSDEARHLQAEIRRSACVNLNHVDHRKVLIADGRSAIVGGMNVGNEYLYLIPPDLSQDSDAEVAARLAAGQAEAWEKWQDSAVLVRGPVMSELAAAFDARWETLGGRPLEADEAEAQLPPVPGDVPVRVLTQRPGLPQISTAMVDLMDSAEDEIYLAYSYVSHPVLLDHLKAASERGVRVVFVLPDAYNDVAISRRMMRLLSGELLDAGVELYEYDDRMNHTKLMVVDGRYASIGSHNFNYRSVRHDLELNLLIEDPAFAGEVVRRVFEPYVAHSERLTVPYDLNWNPIDRLVRPFT